MQPIQRRILFVLILAAGLAWIGVSANPAASSAVAAPQVGFAAPDFSLQTLEGGTYTLSDLRGQVVLVNLWATWCPPCRAEMPAIQKVYAEYQGQGLVVLGINSTVQDDLPAVAPFITEYGLTFPILLDDTGKVSSMYQLRSLPSSYFIDREGVIRYVVSGPMSEALLYARIGELLK
jgi:cytochrome c biogenesis protein CcmG, thiol:disulfide interchange protein DsbE